MTNGHRIHPQGEEASAAIKDIAAGYDGQSVDWVRRRILDAFIRLRLEPNENLQTVAQRIVDGHRGDDIFDY